MNLSYWEYKSWLSHIDFTIVGSGIVGLTCALHLNQKHPTAKILILEKGILPQGASTKNAGFACFGSMSEILSDLNTHSKEEVFQLIKKRFLGIQLLRETLGDKTIDFQQLGGHELFFKNNDNSFEKCLESIAEINKLLHPIFGSGAFKTTENHFDFKGIKDHYITQIHEGQIDTGKMMTALLNRVRANGVLLLNSVTFNDYTEEEDKVIVSTDKFEFKTRKLFLATNGFSSEFIEADIMPARAQVLITKPIKNLKIKGTFHLDQGYNYFRNIDNRILLGGGRNIDFKTEETIEFGLTQKIQNFLETLLKNNIAPQTEFEIDRSWSGIMAIGQKKTPIVKQISNHVFCGVRLGGMGVAIGSLTGKEMSALL